MKGKVDEALGEIEYQLDIFMDNGYKSNFKTHASSPRVSF